MAERLKSSAHFLAAASMTRCTVKISVGLSISTDILWRVFHYVNGTDPYMCCIRKSKHEFSVRRFTNTNVDEYETGSVRNSPQNIRGYTDIFTVCRDSGQQLVALTPLISACP